MSKIIINKKNCGFTLIEVVVSIIIVAILGSFMVSLMGTGLNQSMKPARNIQDISRLDRVMESINADYFAMLNEEDLLASLHGRIVTIYNDSAYSIEFNSFDDFNGSHNEPGASGYVSGQKILKVTIIDNTTKARNSSLFFESKK